MELMVVIAIVALLTAIALPNFTGQAAKAKMTEAQSLAAASLKQAAGYFWDKGSEGVQAWAKSGSCPPETQSFKFDCFGAEGTLPRVIAKGKAGSGLDNQQLLAEVDLDTKNSSFGQIKMCGTMPGLPKCSPGG